MPYKKRKRVNRLEKTLKLMIKKQNSPISVRKISAATRIATCGIYHYFSGKKQIYDEITEKYAIKYVKFSKYKPNAIPEISIESKTNTPMLRKLWEMI